MPSFVIVPQLQFDSGIGCTIGSTTSFSQAKFGRINVNNVIIFKLNLN